MATGHSVKEKSKIKFYVRGKAGKIMRVNFEKLWFSVLRMKF